MGGSLSLYLAATPVVSRRRYSSSFVSPSRYLRPRLHWPPFVGIKIGMVLLLLLPPLLLLLLWCCVGAAAALPLLPLLLL